MNINFWKALVILDSIYSTVVLRDILERERRRGQRQITDPELLRKIIFFLADYISDIGLRNYLLGFRDSDRGHIMENIVYFELLRRGYDVAIGKLGDNEIDFIASKADEKRYIQVTESMRAPETRARELLPLRKIPDNHEKLVIARDCDFSLTEDGIKCVRMTDFLLDA